MGEENLSPLSKSILRALEKAVVESDQQRQLAAQEQGLPGESTWSQIGSEAVRKTVMHQNRIVANVSEVNPLLAAKLKRCYEDGLPLLQNTAAKPEDPTAKLAAAMFLHDYADLRDYISLMTKPSVLAERGITGKQQGRVADWSQGVLHSAWQLYENYGNTQNLVNCAGYSLSEDEILGNLPKE